MAKDEPDWTLDDGDPVDTPERRKPKRMITDFLGDKHISKLSEAAKRATYEDLLRKMGFVPPDDTSSNPSMGSLTDADLLTIARAIEDKTGWRYFKTQPPACCCTWPGWPR